MKDLHKAAESLAVGMARALNEWVNSCMFGALIIALLLAATALYVLLNEFTHFYQIIVAAFQQ